MEGFHEILSHPISAVILLLGVLVFVHEAGHFLVGKWCGIKAEIFSIGFGPAIIKFNRNGTEYRLSIIPLGGFVKFFGSIPGEEVPDAMRDKAYCNASLVARSATIAAGPFANFLLAIACYAAMGLHGIEHPQPLVGEIIPGSPAEQAGLKYGDLVQKINDTDVQTWQDLHDAVYEAPGQRLRFTVNRQGKTEAVTVTAEEVKPSNTHQEPYGRIGISPGRVPAVITVRHPETPAGLSGLRTGDRIKELVVGDVTTPVKFFREFKRAFAQQVDADVAEVILQVSGQDGVDRTVTLPVNGLRFDDLGIMDSQLTIGSIKDFPDKSKLLPGDVVLSFAGQQESSIFGLSKNLADNEKEVVAVSILRAGQELSLDLKLQPMDVQRVDGKKTIYVLPVEFWGQLESGEPVVESYGLFGAIGYGIAETGRKTAAISGAILKLFTGDMPLQALGGPISIAKVASDSVKMGWLTFLSAMALISINLGLLNLVPIPVLDGGQLVLIGFEALRRKPLSQLAIENFQKVGFVMVLGLVVMATYNDFSRFWTSMLKGVSGFFE